MVKHKCSICNSEMVKFRRVPSALDDIVCPKCGWHDVGFFVPPSLGLCVVGCLCDACGHKWSVHVVLPKNFFGKNFGKK